MTIFTLLWLMILVMGCAKTPTTTSDKTTLLSRNKSKGLLAGQGSSGPWWMQQTAMTKEGKIDLKSKPWWGQAAKLKVGEQFVIEASGEAAGRMLVRREKFTNRAGKKLEGIVWVIDDDADGSISSGGDKNSDCYVVDYGCDGVVDRMVDYIDNDGDDDPDEMDIRYFVDGELRYTWFGVDIDDDNLMWPVMAYEYGPDFFHGDAYGNSMIYMNKLNSASGQWMPISECPFAFYDTDGDGFSEVVARVSAVPIDYDTSVDPDYANDYRRFREKWGSEIKQMGVVNIRYSFDIDNGSCRETPLHYEMGFNLVGSTPYKYPGMGHYNPKRRPPQVTCVTPWKDLRKISDNFEAKETGFSWHENFDDTIAVGHGEHKENDYRWEGVFWIWERRFMENTGGPCQKWNVRREWSSKPANKRELYYSDVDKRIHLFGAEEGWLEVGHFGGMGSLGEVRMFDTDKNGYFDRWEYYSSAMDKIAQRVVTVRDEKAQRIEWNYEAVSKFYTEDVLGKAMAANERLMNAMNELLAFEVPAGLKTAMATGSANFRRYAQDVVREMQYQKLQEHFTKQAHQIFKTYDKTGYHLGDLYKMKKEQMETTKNSSTAWRLLRVLAELETAYGQGDYDKACKLVTEIAKINGVFK